MIQYLGDFAEDETVYMYFNTYTSNDPSASSTITNFANTDVHIHKDGNTTQRNNAAGITVAVDYDGITGTHLITIDTSDDTVGGFWVTGSDYMVRIEGTTIDGATINAGVGTFSIENRFNEVDVTKILGHLLTQTGTQLADGFEKFFDVATPTGTVNSLPGAAPDAAGGLVVSDAGGFAIDTTVGSDGKVVISTDAQDLSASLDVNTKLIEGADATDTLDTSAQTGAQAALVTNNLDHLMKTATGAADMTTEIADNTALSRIISSGDTSVFDPTTDSLQDIRDKLTDIETDTGEIGAGGSGLSAVPWNGNWDAEVESECNDALVAQKLDHLVAVADSDDAVDNSIVAKLAASDGDWSGYTPANESLEALRARGDAAWTTGGGGSITDILNVQPLIPNDIDLANTVTVRIGLGLTNMLDDLPSTAEITPGTIDIDRKAIGGTSWSNVVNAAACSEAAGLVYYDEVFDTGTGYAEGDSIRITFKSQKITVAANDYEITDATGWIFQTSIRQTMRGTDGANTVVPDAAGVAPTAVENRQEMDSNSTQLSGIKSSTDNLPADPASETNVDANETKIDTLTTRLGTPANIDSGGATIADNLKKMADDNAGADFDATTDSLEKLASAPAPSAATIAAAVWDRLLSLHTIVGSAGKKLADVIDTHYPNR